MEPLLLNQLRKNDILKSPVWKFWYEDGLEKIAPVDISHITENSLDVFIVLTEFTLSNQSSWIGFCSPQDSSGIDYIQPVIITEKEQISFYKDSPWTKHEKEVELLKLGYSSKEVFPIRFKTKVKCDKEYFSSKIWDFEP